MLQYIVKRLLGLLPTLLIVGGLVFMFVHLLPGDPARLAAGPDATPETVALVRQDLGLDRSLPEQFVRFTTGVLRGDFGRSLRTKRPVSTEVGERFMPTFWLTLAALLSLGIVGLLKGTLSPATSGSAGMLFGLGIDGVVLLYLRYLEEREAVRVGIPGHDPMDAMLTHQDRSVDVVEHVAA